MNRIILLLNKNKYISKNKGSAVVEATLIIPVFLFAMLALYGMCRCKLAEGIIYEAAYETAEYMAEYSYLSEPDTAISTIMLPQYIDNEKLVNECIKGGIGGIDYLGTDLRDGEDYVVLKVNYTLRVDFPFIPALNKRKQIVIRQRAYIGEGENNGKDVCPENDKYVYVSENRDVYHDSRMCTHLMLSVHASSYENAEKLVYTACEFCGDKCKEVVYITDEGKRYHSKGNCSGLKRTVYRVRLSETGDLPGCSRCTNQ